MRRRRRSPVRSALCALAGCGVLAAGYGVAAALWVQAFGGTFAASVAAGSVGVAVGGVALWRWR